MTSYVTQLYQLSEVDWLTCRKIAWASTFQTAQMAHIFSIFRQIKCIVLVSFSYFTLNIKINLNEPQNNFKHTVKRLVNIQWSSLWHFLGITNETQPEQNALDELKAFFKSVLSHQDYNFLKRFQQLTSSEEVEEQERLLNHDIEKQWLK